MQVHCGKARGSGLILRRSFENARLSGRFILRTPPQPVNEPQGRCIATAKVLHPTFRATVRQSTMKTTPVKECNGLSSSVDLGHQLTDNGVLFKEVVTKRRRKPASSRRSTIVSTCTRASPPSRKFLVRLGFHWLCNIKEE